MARLENALLKISDLNYNMSHGKNLLRKGLFIVFLIMFSIQSKAQFVFTERGDTIFFDSKKCRLKIDSIDFSGVLVLNTNPYFIKNILVQLPENRCAIVEFSGNLMKIDNYSTITILNAWIFNDNIASLKNYYNPQYLLSSNLNNLKTLAYHYASEIIYSKTNDWYTTSVFENTLARRKKEKERDSTEVLRIKEFDSVVNLSYYIGTYNVNFISLSGKDVQSLKMIGKIYLTEAGCTLNDFSITFPSLRFSFNRSEYIKAENGTFHLSAIGSTPYDSGVLIINSNKKIGSVSLANGKTTVTATFQIVN